MRMRWRAILLYSFILAVFNNFPALYKLVSNNWSLIVQQHLLPRLPLAAGGSGLAAAGFGAAAPPFGVKKDRISGIVSSC
jgi:hypothetical protein